MNNKIVPWSKGSAMFPVPPRERDICCPYCGKVPSEIKEYLENEDNMDPVEYVQLREGTYCQFTGLFACTECYIGLRMPLNEDLHLAFPDYRLNVQPLFGQDDDEIEKFLLEVQQGNCSNE